MTQPKSVSYKGGGLGGVGGYNNSCRSLLRRANQSERERGRGRPESKTKKKSKRECLPELKSLFSVDWGNASGGSATGFGAISEISEMVLFQGITGLTGAWPEWLGGGRGV